MPNRRVSSVSRGMAAVFVVGVGVGVVDFFLFLEAAWRSRERRETVPARRAVRRRRRGGVDAALMRPRLATTRRRARGKREVDVRCHGGLGSLDERAEAQAPRHACNSEHGLAPRVG